MTTEPSPEGPRQYRRLFTQQVQRPEEDLQMDRAALYVAGEEYPDLDVDAHLDSLDRLAGQVLTETGDGVPLGERAARLGRFLFEEQGFRGNSADYYSPDNSYLNRVLETRNRYPHYFVPPVPGSRQTDRLAVPGRGAARPFPGGP